MSSVFDRPVNGFDLLHPVARKQFEDLAWDLRKMHADGTLKTRFMPFETYRYPQRQLVLISKGTTKALPFQSAHQYGLAVDFVPQITEGGITTWSWHEEHPWNMLKVMAMKHGLTVPISWDKPHVQHPLFDQIRKHW